MKKLVVATVFIVQITVPSHSKAEEFNAETVCQQLAPVVLQMADAMSGIPDAFAEMTSKLSKQDQEKFSETAAEGIEMAQSAKEYRAAVLKACYGS